MALIVGGTAVDATATEINNALDGMAQGDIVYASDADTPAQLTKGTDDYVLTMNGNVPNWEAAAGGGGLTGQFMVHLTADQSLSSGVWAVVDYDDEVGLDENGYFSGNNYTPSVAGYYFLFFRGRIYGLDDGERFQMHIENSYDEHQRLADEVGVYEDNDTVFCGGSVIVYADGSNDTFRVRAIQTDAGSLNLSGGNWNDNYPNSWTYFGGWRIK